MNKGVISYRDALDILVMAGEFMRNPHTSQGAHPELTGYLAITFLQRRGLDDGEIAALDRAAAVGSLISAVYDGHEFDVDEEVDRGGW